MNNKLESYGKYVRYGILTLVVGSLLLLAYKIIDNGPYLLNQIWQVISGFMHIISPIVYAFILAYLLYGPVIFVEKNLFKLWRKKEPTKKAKGLIRLLSIVTIFAFVVLLIITIINYIIPPFVDNVKILIHSIPDFQEKVMIWIKEMTEYLGKLDIDVMSNGKLMLHIQDILVSIGQNILNGITSFIGQLSTFVIDAVITVILAFYFLKDKEKLFAAIDKFGTIVCSPKVKSNIKIFFKDLDDIVGKFLVGTIFACFIVGLASTALMLIIKHPFAVLIGVGAGLTNIIPYVGPIIGATLAFVLGVFTSLELGITGAVLLLLYQQVDGNLIQPKIVGDQVGVAPVWILIAVLIGGSYFGGLGMIISVPIAGLIAVYIDRIYKRKMARVSKE